ncbi:hypothetical protein [Actinoplanes auranticolor]|uniref:Uncharacterized protein n=1 Tax=Actinoplanes auranticolor TaxID=47988 RepID=A0A919VT48_9ACTN|nr:hypothetical protein [Actinoplanes auranticolor]GIM74862.1 hypothetical protein Aau02nite_63020 [Actinoplanes auranticolor]
MVKVASGTSGFALVLLWLITVIQLVGVAVASAGFDEIADASPFGQPGTAIVAAAIAVVASGAAVVAWQGATPAVCTVAAVATFAAVGIVALMALSFVVAGGTATGFAILLVLAAVMIAMIGWAALQSRRGSER